MTRFRPFLVGGVLGALGLGVLPLSGLLPSSAQPGQAPVLDWYFNMAAQQSITLRSLGVEVPPLNEPGMAERGAGHLQPVGRKKRPERSQRRQRAGARAIGAGSGVESGHGRAPPS